MHSDDYSFVRWVAAWLVTGAGAIAVATAFVAAVAEGTGWLVVGAVIGVVLVVFGLVGIDVERRGDDR